MNFIKRTECLDQMVKIHADILKNPDTFDVEGHLQSLKTIMQDMRNSPAQTLELQGANHVVLCALFQACGDMKSMSSAAMAGINLLPDSKLTRISNNHKCALEYMLAYSVLIATKAYLFDADEKEAVRGFLKVSLSRAPNNEYKAMILGGMAMAEFMINEQPEKVDELLAQSVKLGGEEQLAKERGEGFGERLQAVIPESWKTYTKEFEAGRRQQYSQENVFNL